MTTISKDATDFNFDHWSALLGLSPSLSLKTCDTDQGVLYSVVYKGKNISVHTDLLGLNSWVEYHSLLGLNILKQKVIECQGATLRHLDSPGVAEYWSVMTTFYVGMRNRKIGQRNAIQEKLGASA